MKKFSEMKFVKPSMKKIEKDLKGLLDAFENASSFEEQDKVLTKINKYNDHLSTNMVIAMIRYSLDTTSEENQKNQEFIDESEPIIGVYLNNINRALVNAKFRPQLEEKWGSYLFKKLGQDFANIHISRRYLCIKNGIFAFCAKKKECIYIIMNI